MNGYRQDAIAIILNFGNLTRGDGHRDFEDVIEVLRR